MAHPQQGGGHYDDGYGHANDGYYQDDQNQAYYDHNQGYGNGQDSYYDEGCVKFPRINNLQLLTCPAVATTTKASTPVHTKARARLAKKATTTPATMVTRTSTTTTNIMTRVPTLQASKVASQEVILRKTRRHSAISP